MTDLHILVISIVSILGAAGLLELCDRVRR